MICSAVRRCTAIDSIRFPWNWHLALPPFAQNLLPNEIEFNAIFSINQNISMQFEFVVSCLYWAVVDYTLLLSLLFISISTT